MGLSHCFTSSSTGTACSHFGRYGLPTLPMRRESCVCLGFGPNTRRVLVADGQPNRLQQPQSSGTLTAVTTTANRKTSTWCATLLGLLATSCATPAAFAPQPSGWDELTWTKCPAGVPGAERGTCALAEVPLDWDEPDGRQIVVFARRFVPPGPIHGQLWALDGGPGESGDGLTAPWLVDLVTKSGYELIVPTHRGTTYGTALQCTTGGDLEACVGEMLATWGDGLRQFSARAAARDVVALARGHRPAGDGPALLFGGSYGTIWLQRVLQAAPMDFAGAYLDSAGDLDMNLERIGTWSDAAGRELLGRCASTPACSQRFPDGVEATVQRVHGEFVQNEGCARALGVDLSRLQVELMRLLTGTDTRALIAPLIARLARCNPGDRDALAVALGDRETGPHVSSGFNPLLNLTATYLELYRVTLSAPELRTLASSLLFESGAMLDHARKRALYPEDFTSPNDSTPTSYAGPLHVVQGALDPQTPPDLARALIARWAAASGDLVLVPDGGHASVRFTRLSDGGSCTQQWLRGFLDDPKLAFEASCLDQVATIDLAATAPATQALARELFGTPDAWGSN